MAKEWTRSLLAPDVMLSACDLTALAEASPLLLITVWPWPPSVSSSEDETLRFAQGDGGGLGDGRPVRLKPDPLGLYGLRPD